MPRRRPAIVKLMVEELVFLILVLGRGLEDLWRLEEVSACGEGVPYSGDFKFNKESETIIENLINLF